MAGCGAVVAVALGAAAAAGCGVPGRGPFGPVGPFGAAWPEAGRAPPADSPAAIVLAVAWSTSS